MDSEDKVYLTRRAPYFTLAAVFLFLILIVSAHIHAVKLRGAAPGIVALDFFVLALLGVVISLYSAIRRRFLRITASGISIGNRWRKPFEVAWDSVGPFRFEQVRVLYLRKRPLAAVADIMGPNASTRLQRRKRIMIPDGFDMPLETIVWELNRVHPNLNYRADPDMARVGAGVPPWATLGLIAVLVAIYIVQVTVSRTLPAPFTIATARVLWAFGGTNGATIFHDGEWYRLFSAPLLHASFLHLFSNVFALLIVGLILERLLGHAWLLALFFAGAFSGAMASCLFNPPLLVAVGASGAIAALCGATVMTSFAVPPGPLRGNLRAMSVVILALVFWPAHSLGNGLKIDQFDHLGGLLAGIVVTPLSWRQWRIGRDRPERLLVAQVILLIGIVAAEIGLAMAAFHYAPDIRRIEALIPESRVPRTPSAEIAQGTMLVAAYPHDPRAHYFYARTLMARRDYPGAEGEFLAARSLETSLDRTDVLDRDISLFLTIVLIQQGKRDAAVSEAMPLCSATIFAALQRPAQAFLTGANLCR